MLIQVLEDGRRLFDLDGLVDYISSFLGDMSAEYDTDPVAAAALRYTQKWLADANYHDSQRMDELMALYMQIFGHGISTDDDEYFYSAVPEEG